MASPARQLRPLDFARLDAALLLAEQAIGLSDPNPRVGCIIGTDDGQVLGQGHTQEAGGPHAEVVALRDAHSVGAIVRGATAWVTLEPCAHHGRTPPCCDALIAAGIARVVLATQDPFPQVAGQGIARMRAAGIDVTMADAPIAERARDLNIGFFSRFERGRPWIRLKVAASMDGLTALPSGQSQWITGPEARADGHAWRRRAGAVLTGVGTVLADDPRLDVRLVPTAVQPLRVVLDSRWRSPPDARIYQPPGRCLLVSAIDGGERATAARSRGLEVVTLPSEHGLVDLPALIAELARRDVNELHVEAGAQLSGSFLAEQLVDEILVYQAPVVIGQGRPMFRLPAPEDLQHAPRFVRVDACTLGHDLFMRFRVDPSRVPKADEGVGNVDTLGS